MASGTTRCSPGRKPPGGSARLGRGLGTTALPQPRPLRLSPCASSPYFITEASYIWRFRSLGGTQTLRVTASAQHAPTVCPQPPSALLQQQHAEPGRSRPGAAALLLAVGKKPLHQAQALPFGLKRAAPCQGCLLTQGGSGSARGMLSLGRAKQFSCPILHLQASRNGPEEQKSRIEELGVAQGSPCTTRELCRAKQHSTRHQASSTTGSLLNTDLLKVLVCPDGERGVRHLHWPADKVLLKERGGQARAKAQKLC